MLIRCIVKKHPHAYQITGKGIQIRSAEKQDQQSDGMILICTTATTSTCMDINAVFFRKARSETNNKSINSF